jgi:hypothetical protein
LSEPGRAILPIDSWQGKVRQGRQIAEHLPFKWLPERSAGQTKKILQTTFCAIDKLWHNM